MTNTHPNEKAGGAGAKPVAEKSLPGASPDGPRSVAQVAGSPAPGSVVAALDAKLGSDKRTIKAPLRASFEEFLEQDARVPIGGGECGPYSFAGREVLRIIVRQIDHVLGVRGTDGSNGTNAITDCITNIAGGAQWGKTVLELNLAAYATAQRFLNVGLFLPDDKLVDGVVDTKLRPEVIDQIPWFADMTRVGVAVNKSGKATNRKGAFMVTDGQRKASGLVMGLQKVPTTYSLDVAAKDELDDIPPKNEKFVKGRLTASKLRYTLNIGTQRVHGRGQQAKWKGSSQGVVLLPPLSRAGEVGSESEAVTAPEGWINPEEAFPGIIRCQLGAAPASDDPQLTWTGDFRQGGTNGETVATHKPGNIYYLAHPETGEALLRSQPICCHRQPAQLTQNNWGIRVSQLGIGAIGLSQIVGQFQLAVNDPDEMVVFRCDVLALPQSLAQALSPSVLDRARELDPYEVRLRVEPGRAAFGGLDTGDKCWLWINEVESGARKRLIYPASIAAADLVPRTVSLFHQLGLAALFVDQRPLVSQARDLGKILNGLEALQTWPEADAANWITFPGGLAWNPVKKRWTGLRCAVVRFDKKQIGQGIEHGFDIFDEGGMTKFVPLIRCNREETIDRAVRSFLTPAEGVNEVLPPGTPGALTGGIRSLPAQLLPVKGLALMETVEGHLVTGSEREKGADGSLGEYVDECANHSLLAKGYCDLAENECAGRNAHMAFSSRTVRHSRRERSEGRKVRA